MKKKKKKKKKTIKKKKKKKKKKSAKKTHDRVLKEILNYYENNPANQRMFSASKARRNTLKYLAGKKLKFNRVKPGILSNTRLDSNEGSM